MSSEALRSLANAMFVRGDHGRAAVGYTAALEAAASEAEPTLPAVLALSNRAQCWLRLGVPVRALDDTWAAWARCEASPAAVADSGALAKVLLRRVCAFEALSAVEQGLELAAWALRTAPRTPAFACLASVKPALRSVETRLAFTQASFGQLVHEPYPRPPAATCKALKPEGTHPPPRRFAGVAVLRDGVYLCCGAALRHLPHDQQLFDKPLADVWRLPLPQPRDGWRWEQLQSPPPGSPLAAGGACVAARCGDAKMALLPVEAGGVWTFEPEAARWHAVATPAALPPGADAAACDAEGSQLVVYTLEGALLLVRLADGNVQLLAEGGGRNGPRARRGGSLALVRASDGELDVVLRGGLDVQMDQCLSDCWLLRLRGGGGNSSWQRMDKDGGGVPPPPLFGAPSCSLAEPTSALMALFGGCNPPRPGGPCHNSGCRASMVQNSLFLLRSGGAGWAPVRYTGDTPSHWPSVIAPLANPSKLLLVCATHSGNDDAEPVWLYQITLPSAAELAAYPSSATQPTSVAAMLAAEGPALLDMTSPAALAIMASKPEQIPRPWPGPESFIKLVDGLVDAPVDEQRGWYWSWSAQSPHDFMVTAGLEPENRFSMGLFHHPPRAVDLAWMLVCALTHQHTHTVRRPSTIHVGARCRHLLPALAPLLARLGIVPRLETWQEGAAKALRNNTNPWGFNGEGSARCQACGAQVKLRKCSSCVSAPYCGADCAARDWPEHRAACIFIKETKRKMERGEPPKPPGVFVPTFCPHSPSGSCCAAASRAEWAGR